EPTSGARNERIEGAPQSIKSIDLRCNESRHKFSPSWGRWRGKRTGKGHTDQKKPLRRVSAAALFPNLRDACDTHTARIRCLPLLGPAARGRLGDDQYRSPSPRAAGYMNTV